MKYFHPWQIKIFKISILLLAFVPTLLVCADIYRAYHANSMLGVASNGFLLLGSLYLYGIVGSYLYSGNIAGSFTDFLLYPKQYMKAPPVVTTRQRGLITAGKYELAERELLELRATHPASPELAMLLADLHADSLNSPEQAVADIMYFRLKRRWRYHGLNLQMIIRCSEFLLKLNQTEQAVELLESETKIPFVYTKREREILRQRIEILKTQLT